MEPIKKVPVIGIASFGITAEAVVKAVTDRVR